DKMKKLVEEMQTIIDRADQLANAAENKVELENATGQFVTMQKLKQKAEARALELKQGFEADREAMKRLDKVLIAAEKALAQAKGLPGASEQAKQIQTLITLARNSVQPDGELSRGQSKALEMLLNDDTGYAALLEKAKEAASSFTPDPA